MINGLDLFEPIPALSICSGIGGLDEGVERFFKAIAYCEFDPYAQGALISRMRRGEIPNAPIWDDLTTLRGNMLPKVNAIFGGPPCQDYSCAGAKKGILGDKGRLMLETIRIVSECRPEFVFLENVPDFSLRGLDQVCLEFHAIGYDCQWTTLSAGEVGTPFQGDRLFLLASPSCERYGDLDQQESISGSEGPSFSRGNSQRMAPVGQAPSTRLEGRNHTRSTWAAFAEHRHSGPDEWPSWLPVPAFPRGHDGLLYRNHAIRCSGNGVVSLQAEKALERLLGIERGIA